ncbi:MAG: type I glyceraldehyde-3-phosphate dehydrogenase [Acidobacteriota bacterium]
MRLRLGINGLGRIGRGFLRESLREEDIDVVAVNDLAAPDLLAHLVCHDSLFGRSPVEVTADPEALRAGGRTIRCTRVPRPSEIPWSEEAVDLVLESTGVHAERVAASGHLKAGAARVIITSPSPDADLTVCFGVNHERYDPGRHRILSNASCTTNAMAVVMAVAERTFGIERAAMTTVHCYTNDQVLMDAPHRDRRRARAAGMSMIPTTTSAARAIVQVLPSLRGRVRALAVRVPTAAVSLVDLTLILRRHATLEEARGAFRDAADGRMRGILGYTEEELVSIDFLGDERSAVVDGALLALDGGTVLKVLAWYDNERGYVRRLIDLVRYLARREGAAGRS